MPQFRTRRVVRHSAQQMFDLVADAEKYPQFVPLCERLVIKTRSVGDDGRETLTATMTIAYKVFRESFTSRVVLDKAANSILVTYLDGPFRHLENRWGFSPRGDTACEVDFFLSYEFASRTLGFVMGAVFDGVFSRFAEAFESRADKIYGKS